MKIKKLVEILGGQRKTAEYCNVTQQAVSLWIIKDEVPWSRIALLVLLAQTKANRKISANALVNKKVKSLRKSNAL